MRYKAHSLFASFRYAVDGVGFTLRTQRNMRVHFSSAVLAAILAVWLHIGRFELLLILMASTLVVVCEMINTAVENAVDLATHRRHPLAKAAKDVAAAAVLISALNALIIGGAILLPPLIRIF